MLSKDVSSLRAPFKQVDCLNSAKDRSGVKSRWEGLLDAGDGSHSELGPPGAGWNGGRGPHGHLHGFRLLQPTCRHHQDHHHQCFLQDQEAARYTLFLVAVCLYFNTQLCFLTYSVAGLCLMYSLAPILVLFLFFYFSSSSSFCFVFVCLFVCFFF